LCGKLIQEELTNHWKRLNSVLIGKLWPVQFMVNMYFFKRPKKQSTKIARNLTTHLHLSVVLENESTQEVWEFYWILCWLWK